MDHSGSLVFIYSYAQRWPFGWVMQELHCAAKLLTFVQCTDMCTVQKSNLLYNRQTGGKPENRHSFHACMWALNEISAKGVPED